MAGSRNASAWTLPLALLLAGLFISSFFVPFREKTEEWIPLLSGFVDVEAFYLSRAWLAAGGILSIFLLIVPLYFINSRALSKSFRIYYTLLFCMLVILVNPMSVYFSTIYPAAICITWMQYCLIIRQRFIAFLLLSLASLFYAPVMWAIPVVLAVSLIGTPDIFRAFLKCMGGLLIPYIYLFSFRYIYFNDTEVFIQQYLQEMIKIEIPVYSLSFTNIFVVICFLIITLHAVFAILGKLGRQSILTGHILKTELVTFLLGAIIFALFWGVTSLPLCVLLAPTLALLLSNYFTQDKVSRAARAELILLMGAVAVARAAYFMN